VNRAITHEGYHVLFFSTIFPSRTTDAPTALLLFLPLIDQTLAVASVADDIRKNHVVGCALQIKVNAHGKRPAATVRG